MPGKWPEKGTPEYAERVAKAVAARAASRRASAQASETPKEAPLDTDEVFDLDDPKQVRMEPERAPKTASATKGRKKVTPPKQSEVHDWIKRPLDLASRFPGHEHWHRQDDEIACIAEPATRILERHPGLVDAIRSVSDPVALIAACCMILGPSIAEEIRNVRARTEPRRSVQQRPAYQQPEPPGGAGEGPGGGDFIHASKPTSDGAAPTAPVAGIPTSQF